MSSTGSNTKQYHICFAYPITQPRMHFDEFPNLHFVSVEGCDDDEAMVHLVRISLHKNNGRRGVNILNLVDDYNANIVSSKRTDERIVPVVYGGNSDAIKFFKISSPLTENPILARIDQGRRHCEPTYWKWTPAAGGGASASSTATVSMKDILASMQLPPSRVTVARAIKELTDRYAREFDGAILGKAVPVSRKQFVVAEIRRSFCEDFHYVQQPSIGHRLPVEVQSTLADLLGTSPDGSAEQLQQQLRPRRRKYVRATDAGECDPVVDFLAHHALQWNDTGFDSTDDLLVQLHAAWPGNGTTTVESAWIV